MSFIPASYDVSQLAGSSAFFKIADGSNQIRILSHELAFGFEYWTKDNKPKRVKNRPANTPSDIRTDDNGKPDPVRHIWVMQVWDYADSQVKVWSFYQNSLMKPMSELFSDADWGHPQEYDLKIVKKGSGLKTEYSVIPCPKKALTQAQKEAIEDKVNGFDLNTLFVDGGTQAQSAPATQVKRQFGADYGTPQEGIDWAISQGLTQEQANALRDEVNAIYAQKKEQGEDMTPPERRLAFMAKVRELAASLPEQPQTELSEEEVGVDNIPF